MAADLGLTALLPRTYRTLAPSGNQISVRLHRKGSPMRKFLLPLVAAGLLLAAGAAGNARTAVVLKTVKITSAGYVPTSVSIPIGDAVAFMNSDTVSHTVDFKQTTGMQCNAALPLALAAGQSATCKFTSAGVFDFTDPANKGSAFHGTVVVGSSTSASLSVTPTTVVYGGKVTLQGTLGSQQAGQSLKIQAQQCGVSAPTPLATVTTTAGGLFSYQTGPSKQTSYTVKFKNSTSSAATVQVQPRLRLGKVAPHRYVLRVFAAQSFAGKHATFQRYRLASKRWVTVKTVALRAGSTAVAPTLISSARFGAHVKAGLRVRALLGQAQVGSCYLAGKSNTIRS